MRRNSSKRGKVAATFMAMLLTATFMASLLPEATAALSSVEIVSIDPESGPVGETARVIGGIDTTNGLFQILFDGKEVGNGNATGTAVNVTFTVPLSVEGSHNVTLFDVTTSNQSSPETFTVTTSYYVSAKPAWIREGLNTTITVGVNEAEPDTTYIFTINVTDPQPTPGIYTTTLTVSTNATGSGSNSTFYPESFLGANTDYVGTYTITVIAVNQTFTTGNFTVGAVCQVQAWNVAIPPETVANVTIVARNATSGVVLDWKDTNETGWAEFPVYFGNYTFEALEVDEYIVSLGRSRNQSFTEIKTYRLNLTCWIAHMKIAIRDEAGHPLPFIDVTLNYTYPTINGEKISERSTFETDTTGIVTLRNTFTNTSYTIEARRYGNLFNRTLIENITITPLINITCPTYTMFIHVLDSKGIPLKNVEVAVYEGSSGVAEPVKSGTTDDQGSSVFHFTFGRYKIWVYNDDHTIILNKTVVDLTEDQLFFMVHCKIFNIDLSVIVEDYFGHPISNALVEVEREGVTISQKTGSNGIAPFSNITGGDCQISVSVRETVCETRTLYLNDTKVIVFKLEKFVVAGGYLLEVTQLIAYVSLGIMVALFALALIYRRLRLRKIHEGEQKEKSL